MAYAYMIGLYSTRGIIAKLLSDPGTRTLCQELEIDAYSFRSFRRVNRELIISCLEKIFENVSPSEEFFPDAWNSNARAANAQALRSEAIVRIQRASEMDRKELQDLFF